MRRARVTPPPSARREIAACTLLVILSLLTGLVLLELVCQLAHEVRLLRDPDFADRSDDWAMHDPLLGFVPRPGSVSREGSFDRDGFRITPGATPPNAGLIVATGDSFTFGHEVADDEAWPAILQELTGVRVINAGVSAYGFDQTVLRTERLATQLAPTAMVVGFIASDIWRAEMRQLWGSSKPYFTLGNDGALVLRNVPVPPVGAPDDASLLARLLDRSALVEVVMRRLATYANWIPFEHFADDVRALPAGLGEKVSCALVQRLAGMGAPVLVVAQYDPSFWTDGPAQQAEQRRQSRMLLGCAAAAGLATLDTFGPLQEAIGREGLRPLYLRHHHSALGNKLVARLIGDALAADGMLGRPPRRP